MTGVSACYSYQLPGITTARSVFEADTHVIDTSSTTPATDAAPETVGAALIALHETLTLAQRSAEVQGLTLSDLDTLLANLDALAAYPALLAAMPDLAGMIAEAIELANAQADLADFLPAAGTNTARSVADAIVTATAVSRANPNAGFTRPGGGGLGLPAEVRSPVSPVSLIRR